MNRYGFAVPMVIFVSSLTLWETLPRKGDEKRIDGTVIAAKPTYCEPTKAAGCTGKIVLDARMRRASEALTIEVPLGTPISVGCEALSWGELPGRRVVVTAVDEGRGPVALAISDRDSPARNCG